jgi:hypothetical protein
MNLGLALTGYGVTQPDTVHVLIEPLAMLAMQGTVLGNLKVMN